MTELTDTERALLNRATDTTYGDDFTDRLEAAVEAIVEGRVGTLSAVRRLADNAGPACTSRRRFREFTSTLRAILDGNT